MANINFTEKYFRASNKQKLENQEKYLKQIKNTIKKGTKILAYLDFRDNSMKDIQEYLMLERLFFPSNIIIHIRWSEYINGVMVVYTKKIKEV